MKITSLKIESDSVFVRSEDSEKWLPCGISHVPALEDMLAKMQSQQFGERSSRKMMEFEKEVSLAGGSIKNFRDEDGDFVCTYEKRAETPAAHIDEDLEFRTDKKEDQPNMWGGRRVEEKKKPKTVIRKRQPDPRLRLQVHSSDHALPEYAFKKRPIGPIPSDKQRLLRRMLIEFKRAYLVGIPEQFSYVRKEKWKPVNRVNGDLLKAVFRHKRARGAGNALDKAFSLQI